jgi:hypothetical protein
MLAHNGAANEHACGFGMPPFYPMLVLKKARCHRGQVPFWTCEVLIVEKRTCRNIELAVIQPNGRPRC